MIRPFDFEDFREKFGSIIRQMEIDEELERDGNPRFSRNHMTEAELAEGRLELNEMEG